MIQRSRLERRSRDVVLVLGLLPVMLSGAIILAVARFRTNADWVEHSQKTLIALSTLETSTTQAESGVRAYFITSDSAYLQEFDARRSQALGDMRRLRELGFESQDQAARIESFSLAVRDRLDHLGIVSQLRRAGQSRERIEQVYGQRSRRIIGTLQTLTAHARLEEERLLDRRRTARHRVEVALFWLCACAVLASLAAAYQGARMIRMYRMLRDRAEDELEEANALLERRVNERTSALEQANVDLRQIETELRNTTGALRRSNADLESFAYIASHDLREPLRTIATYVQLLRQRYEGRIDAEADMFIRFATDGATRMQLLIKDLLEYSRASAQHVVRSPASLETILDDVLSDLHASIQEAGAVITHDPLPDVPCDQRKLTLLLQNLLSNAVKFRKPGEPPRIHVTARQAGDEWIVSVRDNGIGFGSEYADRIFGIFKRLHSVREFPGNGIGLAVVKRVAELHGGRAWAESKSGAGSTFYFSLPAKMPPPAAGDVNHSAHAN